MGSQVSQTDTDILTTLLTAMQLELGFLPVAFVLSPLKPFFQPKHKTVLDLLSPATWSFLQTIPARATGKEKRAWEF
jgi:hypothetical protein